MRLLLTLIKFRIIIIGDSLANTPGEMNVGSLLKMKFKIQMCSVIRDL